jgi:putative tryptophan/tyrosine transport system substrate-binding protein
MKRRIFVLFAATALVPPLSATGQSPSIRPVIGFLSSRSPKESAPHVAGFRRGLEDAGYVEGRNVTIVSRWAEGDYDTLEALARELVGLNIAVLVAVGGRPSARAAKKATATMPIVFIGPDPVRAGLVASFNRPGGNITGVDLVTTDLGAKRLELICEFVPHAKTIGLLINPDDQDSVVHRQNVQMAAQSLGRRLVIADAQSEAAFEPAFALFAREQAGGLIVQNDPFFDSQRTRLMALAADNRLPAIYHIREFPTAGGLMSYGASLIDGYRQVGVYAGRILKGTHPADLPILRPTTFELVINRKTAALLGLDVPSTLLASADEVIE